MILFFFFLFFLHTILALVVFMHFLCFGTILPSVRKVGTRVMTSWRQIIYMCNDAIPYNILQNRIYRIILDAELLENCIKFETLFVWRSDIYLFIIYLLSVDERRVTYHWYCSNPRVKPEIQSHNNPVFYITIHTPPLAVNFQVCFTATRIILTWT